MNLSELYENLSYGDLGNLSIGQEYAGDITTEGKPRITHFANQALNILYSRFIMARGFVDFALSADVHDYALRTDDPSIIGSFDGDAIKILNTRVYNAHEEIKDIFLNNRNNLASPRTVGFNKLWIAEPAPECVMVIEYQKKHPKLTGDETQEIELAPVLEPALEALVASRVYAAMNGEGHLAKASMLRSEADSLMGLVDQNDLLSLSEFTDEEHLFSMKGFK